MEEISRGGKDGSPDMVGVSLFDGAQCATQGGSVSMASEPTMGWNAESMVTLWRSSHLRINTEMVI